ncbi:MAG: RagB/SusD protein [Gemmatimonadetes bacterium]|nr:RagB/SusD protein [Gemmatimonadota bacterium]
MTSSGTAAMHRRRPAIRPTLMALAAGALALAGCNITETLRVTDPDIIPPSDVQSPAGANGVRIGAIARLNFATSGGSSGSEGLFLLSGLFADEWINGDSFIARWDVDRRAIKIDNNFLTDVDRMLNRARLSGAQAVVLLKQYVPTGPAADVAEMYFVQGYAENLMAEHYCNGIVLANIANGVATDGSPMPYNAVYATALAHADSGLALITGSTAQDVKVRNALRILKGRILLNLNRPAEAAVAVAAVPTSARYLNYHSQTTRDNQIWAFNNVARRYSVANNEGTNGLNFATAADPRLPVCNGGDATCTSIGVTIRSRDDGTVPVTVQRLWSTRDSSVVLASGVEARMIEAEAAYRAGTFPLFVQKLNQARTEGGVAGLPATLVDPVTDVARVNLLFRERAFWMYSTGHRVGDLRRLIRQYGRSSESVFPTGAWHKNGSVYEGDVNWPLPQAEQNNPNVGVTASTCTDRAA